MELSLLILVVLAALIFDFINGFHDTANAIATSVSTRVLRPNVAIVMAAGLNFFGALASTKVAHTIGSGIVDPELVTFQVVLAALISAIAWNLITWYFGIPSSSSHALIGGVVGAVITSHGFSDLNPAGLGKILASLLVSPVLGFGIGFLVMTVLNRIVHNAKPSRVNRLFSVIQIASAAVMAFSHGSNDAQKSMGIITMSLVGAGFLQTFAVPTWVIVACATAMALGTSVGGWRIIKTMGVKIIKLQPIHGFAAETSSSAIILSASALGAPVSTTHVISSCIMGVGATKRIKAVRWGVAYNIVVAWILTLPLNAALASVVFLLIRTLWKA